MIQFKMLNWERVKDAVGRRETIRVKAGSETVCSGKGIVDEEFLLVMDPCDRVLLEVKADDLDTIVGWPGGITLYLTEEAALELLKQPGDEDDLYPELRVIAENLPNMG